MSSSRAGSYPSSSKASTVGLFPKGRPETGDRAVPSQGVRNGAEGDRVVQTTTVDGVRQRFNMSLVHQAADELLLLPGSLRTDIGGDRFELGAGELVGQCLEGRWELGEVGVLEFVEHRDQSILAELDRVGRHP